MNKEIELKAHVDNHQKLLKILTEKYGQPQNISKNDIYYRYGLEERSLPIQPVRLRDENGEYTVNLKRKSVENGIESNEELEFRLEEGEDFIAFMELTGAVRWYNKTKNGWKFTKSVELIPGVFETAVIELCEVSSLGWFLEIEIVLKSPAQTVFDSAKNKILEILKETGISENQIEPRLYSDMLQVP